MAASDDSYGGYLEREMTIMAALSAFCLASVGLWVKVVLDGSGAPAAQLWKQSPGLIMAGCAAEIVAAWLFYLQRSHLCWLYGQICLSLTQGGHPDGVDYRSWLYHADSRASWMAYRAAFYALGLGFWFWALALARQAPIALAGSRPYLYDCLIWAPTIALLGLATLKWRVYTVFHLDKYPWREMRAEPRLVLRAPWTMSYEQVAMVRKAGRKKKA